MGPEGLEKMLQPLSPTKDSEETHPKRPEGFPSIFQPHPMGLKDLKKSFSPTLWALKHPSAPRKDSEETQETHPKMPEGFPSIF